MLPTYLLISSDKRMTAVLQNSIALISFSFSSLLFFFTYYIEYRYNDWPPFELIVYYKKYSSNSNCVNECLINYGETLNSK